MLPPKLTSGMPFKPSIVRGYNAVIDYLKSQRIVGDQKTIKVSQGTAGLMISAIQQGGGRPGSAAAEKHPFKLAVTTVDSESVLTVQRGRVTIQGSTNERCNFVYEPNESGLPVNLPLPDSAGIYNVIGYVVKHLPEDTPANDDGAFRHGVIYSSSNVNGNFSSSYGFCVFVIGVLTVTQNEDETFSYSVTDQYVKSDFIIDDSDYSGLFSPLLYRTSYPEDGETVTDFKATSIRMTDGKIGMDDRIIEVSEDNFELSTGKMIAVEYDSIEKTASYVMGDTASYSYVGAENANVFYFPIVSIANDEYTSWIIHRFTTDFFAGLDTYKIKVDSEDETPEFLQTKLLNDLLGEEDLYDETNYIELKIEEETVNDKLRKRVDIVWNWYNISGYDEAKIQTIINNKNSLIFDDAGKVRVNLTDETLGFLSAKLHDGKYTLARTKSDSYMQIDARGLQAGKHITLSTVADADGDDMWKITAVAPTVNGDSGITVNTTDDGWIINLTSKKYTVVANSPITCTPSSDSLTFTDTFTIGFDFSKIIIDESLAGLIEKDTTTDGQMTLKSPISGTGVLIVQDGEISVLEVPETDSALVATAEGLAWVEIGDC